MYNILRTKRFIQLSRASKQKKKKKHKSVILDGSSMNQIFYINDTRGYFDGFSVIFRNQGTQKKQQNPHHFNKINFIVYVIKKYKNQKLEILAINDL